MLAYCTYCSAGKNISKKSLPAIELYRSERINKVFTESIQAGVEFLILSGKFGLVEPQQKIPFYDHLLLVSEVENHAELVANQLKEKKISQIVFYMASIEQDHNIKPYIDCIVEAAIKIGISVELKEGEFID